MATFVVVHAAGDGAWSWQLVESELRERGHDMVAPDLPANDESAGLWDYAETVVDAIADRTNLVVVAHSFGGFTGPLVCERVPVDALVLVAAMLPSPGEAPHDWWDNTGLRQARQEAGVADADDIATYYHDVPPELTAEAQRRVRQHPSERAAMEPWPLPAWPDVRTHYLLCREDRFLPADWTRRMVADRLGITADELDGGHCPMLSRPADLARRLEAYARPG